MSTSFLVSTGVVSCCPALFVSLFWFVDKKCSSCHQ